MGEVNNIYYIITMALVEGWDSSPAHPVLITNSKRTCLTVLNGDLSSRLEPPVMVQHGAE